LVIVRSISLKSDWSSLPECCSSFSDENGMFFTLGVEEGHELAVAVHVEDAGGGGNDDAAEKVELGEKEFSFLNDLKIRKKIYMLSN